jgi:hypothetical protein
MRKNVRNVVQPGTQLPVHASCTFFIHHSSFDPQAVDIHDIERFKQDPKIKALIRTGDTIGCFYVESPAMRMLLKKLGWTTTPRWWRRAASSDPVWRRAA